MNLSETFKPWFMKANDEKRYYMNNDCCRGQYVYNEGEVKVALKTRTVSEGGLMGVYVDSGIEGAEFSDYFAVGLEMATLGDIEGYFANFRNSPFWCNSHFDTDLTKVHERTQGLLFRYKNGNWGFILPTVDDTYKTNMVGTEGGVSAGMTAYYRLNQVKDQLSFVCGEGDEPYKLMRDCARYAMKLLNNGCSVREERRYPEIFEYLGWCSWDAMEIRVSEAGLVEKCKEFKEKDIPVKWGIIDDMWAECDKLRDIPDSLDRFNGTMFEVMHTSKLRSFEADPKRFPNGLAHCVKSMNEYGVKVGMWHPTTGYWAGLDPEGELAKVYENEFETVPRLRKGVVIDCIVPKYEVGSMFRFYNDWHFFMKQCGVEFVKIDNQSSIPAYATNRYPIGKAARAQQRAIDCSVGANFDNAIINCMGMGNENMFNRPVGAISRCSDDFQPENREWFIKHLRQCAYNSVIQGLFYWSDWDMWWTDDGQAKKNSVLRAISGGPIYISDKLGRSCADIVKPLCYSDGRLLRCEAPALPTVDCLIADPSDSGKPMKIFNTYKVGGVVAAYNLSADEKPVTGTVSAADIGKKYDEYVVYEHFTGDVTVLHGDEVLDIMLKDHDDFRLYTIVPVENGIAMLGLTDKYNSPLAVDYQFNGVWSLYEGGKLSFVVTDGKEYTVTTESGSYKPAVNGKLYTAELPLGDRHVALK
ncbi:MAG: hypothetical protein IJ428_05545 [Clostridia bacterium]|nr:hypothetical protein [Clostridia bacterium]